MLHYASFIHHFHALSAIPLGYTFFTCQTWRTGFYDNAAARSAGPWNAVIGSGGSDSAREFRAADRPAKGTGSECGKSCTL